MTSPRDDAEWPQRWDEGPDLGPEWQRERQRMVLEARARLAPWSPNRAARVWQRIPLAPRSPRAARRFRLGWVVAFLLGGGASTAATISVRRWAAVQSASTTTVAPVPPSPRLPRPRTTRSETSTPPPPSPASAPELRSPRVAGHDDWRRLARNGDYDAAYKQLSAAASSAAPLDAESELVAADVARLSGHLDEAVRRLERLLARRRDDTRAAAAAFTLGRVQLDERGEPEPAARAFELAFRLRPGGVLAEDALARAALAWSRAGNSERAREIATESLRRAPHGAHAERMRALVNDSR